MGTQRLLFMRTPNVGAALIRAVTWSQWSHVALITAEQTVVEAVAFHGVREITLKEAIDRASRHEIVGVPCLNPFAAQAYARSQIGQPYDYLGALGLAFHREWDDPSSWWCSELVEASLAAGGSPRFRADLRRITQQHSWMVSPCSTTIHAGT